MSTSTVTPSRQQLYQIIDQLSDAHADAMLAFAQVLRMDPVNRAIMFAPFDDEPVTEEEQAEVERARKEARVRVELNDLLNL